MSACCQAKAARRKARRDPRYCGKKVTLGVSLRRADRALLGLKKGRKR